MTIPRAFGAVAVADFWIMRRLNRWRPPRWFRWWMLVATRAGDGWLWASCALAILLAGDERRYAAVFAGTVAMFAAIAMFLVVKRAVNRRRPCALEPHCWASLLPPDQFSFPSGHSMTSFAAASALSHYYPEAAPALLACAAAVAVSRVVLGMHFLSDVLAGSALGCAIAWAVVALAS